MPSSIAAALAASPLRIRLISSRVYCTVPQSPGAIVAMWTCQPRWRSRASVPVHMNSASSGWAPILKTVFVACQHASRSFLLMQ